MSDELAVALNELMAPMELSDPLQRAAARSAEAGGNTTVEFTFQQVQRLLLGQRWMPLPSRPARTRVVTNAPLSAALAAKKLEFTRAELDTFKGDHGRGLDGLSPNCVVKAGDVWFQPLRLKLNEDSIIRVCSPGEQRGAYFQPDPWLILINPALSQDVPRVGGGFAYVPQKYVADAQVHYSDLPELSKRFTGGPKSERVKQLLRTARAQSPTQDR